MPGKLIALGDSITYGAWDPAGGWVARLRGLVCADRRSDQWLVHNLGVPGDTSADLLARVPNEVDARLLRDPYPVVATVFVGTNDLKRPDGGAPQVPLERYRHNLSAIVDSLAPRAARVVLVGLPPVGAAAATRSVDDVRRYQAAMSAVADARGLPHVALCEAMDAQMLDADGVHPNGSGHRFIAENVWRAALRTGGS